MAYCNDQSARYQCRGACYRKPVGWLYGRNGSRPRFTQYVLVIVDEEHFMEFGIAPWAAPPRAGFTSWNHNRLGTCTVGQGGDWHHFWLATSATCLLGHLPG